MKDPEKTTGTERLPGQTLGRCEWVSFPTEGATPYRARIDTGARLCSLHAEDIKVEPHKGRGGAQESLLPEQDMLVHFTLPCGRAASVPLVGYSQVKSSNGETENRPTVKLATTLAGVTINTTYTLTDRSSMRYPVLIGRNLLSGRFVVDSGRSRIHPKPKKSACLVDPPSVA